MGNPPKLPVNERTRVVADTVTGRWRVLCPLHGELARYGEFWPASRDAREHDGTCPLVTGEAMADAGSRPPAD